jgi:hypothetical protein
LEISFPAVTLTAGTYMFAVEIQNLTGGTGSPTLPGVSFMMDSTAALNMSDLGYVNASATATVRAVAFFSPLGAVDNNRGGYGTNIALPDGYDMSNGISINRVSIYGNFALRRCRICKL